MSQRRQSEVERGYAELGGRVAQVVRDAAAQGVSPAEMRSVVASLRVRPVITAHPTEAKRVTVLEKHRRIYRRLVDLEAPRWTPRERSGLVDAVRTEIELLWLTGELRLEKPTVAQELAWGLYFVTENLFDVVPELVDRLDRALQRAYPDGRFEVPPFFQFGSWIGGDRDGNPFVTNEATRRTVYENRVASLRRYRQRLAELLRGLSVTERAARIPLKFREALARQLDRSGAGAPIAAPHRGARRPVARAAPGRPPSPCARVARMGDLAAGRARPAAPPGLPAAQPPSRGGRDARHVPADPRAARRARPRGDRQLRPQYDPRGGRRAGRVPARQGSRPVRRRPRHRELHAAGRAAVRVRRRPAARAGDRPGAATGAPDTAQCARPGRRLRGHDRVLRLEQGRGLPHVQLGAGEGAAQAHAARPRVRRPDRVLPRARRGGEPGRRADGARHRRAAGRLDRGTSAHHRAGGGRLVQVRQPRYGGLPDGAVGRERARALPQVRARGRAGTHGRVRRGHGSAVRRGARRLSPADRASPARHVLPGGEPARGDRAAQHRLAPPARGRRPHARRASRQPVGVRLDPEPALYPGLVRGGHR